MKSILLRIATIGMVLMLSVILFACQPTPEVNGVSTEAAGAIILDDNILVEVDDLPDSVNSDVMQLGHLKLSINASVNHPNIGKCYTGEVTKRSFSEDEIAAYISFFTGEENPTVYSEYYQSKDYWLNKITEAKDKDIDNQVYLEYLENQYDSSSENAITEELNYSDIPEEIIFDGYIERTDSTISVCSFSRNYNYFSYKRDMMQDFIPKSIVNEEDSISPESPDISVEEAEAEAEQAINTLGTDLVLLSSEPCAIATGLGLESTGWSLIYTRNMRGLKKLFDWHGVYLNPDSMPSKAAPWEQELVNIVIDDKGIAYVVYQGAGTLLLESVKSVKLADFNSIEDRVLNQFKYIYGTHTNGSGNGLDIKVISFDLGTDMISIEDQPDKGLYIPTWTVTYSYKWQDSDEEFFGSLVFDARNGEYIEPRVTNRDLMENMYGNPNE